MNPCPTPGKHAYRSRRAAKEGIPQRAGKRMRAYRCPCGSWHLTSVTQVELRRKKPMERGSKRLPKQSPKRKVETPERAALIVRVKNRDGHACRAPTFFGAAGIDDPLPVRYWCGLIAVTCVGGLEVHELIRRAQWRAGYLVDDNCVTLCEGHHRWVTLNPEAAIEAGLALKSTDRPTNPGDNPR